MLKFESFLYLKKSQEREHLNIGQYWDIMEL